MSETAPRLEPSWLAVLGQEFQQPYMRQLKEFLVEERKRTSVYPPGPEIFNAFAHTPVAKVRVVILGQDPYHGKGQAHGLCFSVRRGVEVPPSLVNIFRELQSDLGVPPPRHGDLSSWAEQGVFLLNTTLSVRAREAHSHFGRGWETFTDRVIQELARCRQNIVYMLWGRPAQQKVPMLSPEKNLILKAAHPSPLSAYKGFMGCRHFSQANRYLEEHGQAPISWRLPD